MQAAHRGLGPCSLCQGLLAALHLCSAGQRALFDAPQVCCTSTRACSLSAFADGGCCSRSTCSLHTLRGLPSLAEAPMLSDTTELLCAAGLQLSVSDSGTAPQARGWAMCRESSSTS